MKKEGELDKLVFRSTSGEVRHLDSRGLTQTTKVNGKVVFAHPRLFTVGRDDGHEDYLFSPRGDRVITTSSGGDVRIHNTHTGETL